MCENWGLGLVALCVVGWDLDKRTLWLVPCLRAAGSPAVGAVLLENIGILSASPQPKCCCCGCFSGVDTIDDGTIHIKVHTGHLLQAYVCLQTADEDRVHFVLFFAAKYFFAFILRERKRERGEREREGREKEVEEKAESSEKKKRTFVLGAAGMCLSHHRQNVPMRS